MTLLDTFTGRFVRRQIPVVSLVAYLASLLAWVLLVGRWLPMPGSVSGASMTDPGAPEAMALSNGLAGIGLYLLMWGVMMVAMMYPSSVPLFRLYTQTLSGKSRRATAVRVGAFMSAYALVWTLTGLVPLALNAVLPIHSIASGNPLLLFGGTLTLLSGYQLSPYKYRCLRYCRTPLGFLMEYHRPGLRGAVETSVRFSIFCVGCCWALFAVMIAIGSMNLLWMAAITVVLSVERLLGWGDRLATAIGGVAGVSGVALVAVALL